MVTKTLTDFSSQKNAIVSAVGNKITRGLYDNNLHDSFKPSKFDIKDIELIISSIETKLRKIEVIYYTFFDTEYDPNIIVNNSMPVVGGMITNKIIETEFDFGTNILKNRIDVNTPFLYKEMIDTNFQSLILVTASLYEVLVKLCETLLKKIVIYDGEKSPYQSIPLKTFILNWDKLVDLGYRKNDEFYICFSGHRSFINSYLGQINTLRNRFVHGYSMNVKIDTFHNEYVVTNYDEKNFSLVAGRGIITELILNNFANAILINTYALTTDLLNLFNTKLTRATKIPM